jgi:bacterioferritin
MGTMGRKIVEEKLDVGKLLELLNKTLADEWLAYYQYWIGAQIVQGKVAKAIREELEEHAKEELEHAGMLVKQITELGGTPLLSPKAWYEKTNCGYDEPTSQEPRLILEQNIKGERCAIKVYNEILQIVKGKDPITYHIIRKILEDEVEHEDDLEQLLAQL